MAAKDTADHWQALFDNKYLRWFDLNGQPSLCEIVSVQARVELTLPGGAKARKPVVTLKQIQGHIENAKDDNGRDLPIIKPLVLNATNAGAIADMHGQKPSAWKGKQVVLFESTTKVKGKDSQCIRIRPSKA